MPRADDARRRFMLAAGTAGAGLLIAAATGGCTIAAAGNTGRTVESESTEVGAVEDLMREHGVLRRALLVYAESAPKLRAREGGIDETALTATVELFRTFGEDYHERMLEEAYIFPAVRKAGGLAAAYIDVLAAQHVRGREITDYIRAVTGRGRIGVADADNLAHALGSFVLMYQNHAAREDTVVFPAWKAALSGDQLHELSEKFEEIEHRMFGDDGFDDAVKRIADIEVRLGFADLAKFTAPPPPRT